ncbi:phosphonate C-P lyase system protein PhnG [Romeria aff. gracilis LEGE 07310]|uniref:Phosphonate C-P lyase system protein PhnG n=1 Tax=Vasconcelosia minhoensis LEGE 07310 TaxID=915328 RepID=A0A8J7AAE5_9CYAN|nr:phosphonate C-P lyase system protein PhnG [Romeria gracilis]MBE9075899.1 phosphonate C-P lyase system protein PhnG [Romeria aff. gracilis LEGE 07310]
MVDLTARPVWMATLAQAEPTELAEHLATLGELPDHTFLRSPEMGLTMVRGRAGGTGQVFNLGEMTLTRCVVQIEAGAEKIAGFGYVAGRDRVHATQAALCDALMQHPAWYETVQNTVIQPLQASAEQQQTQQQRQTAATQVNFFTMQRGE